MFSHYVRVFSTSSLILAEAQTFSFADSQVIVWDNWHNDIHQGLNFAIRLTATDLYSAMKKSLPAVLPLANMLASTHATAIGNPHVIFGLDLGNSAAERQFGQVIYNVPSSWLRRRLFDKDAFGKFWSAFLASENDSALVDAVNSGMSHLRKSFQSATLIDEFFEHYSGLESLNSALQRKYNLPTTDSRKCTCGQLIRMPVATGIRHAIIKLAGKSPDVWRTVREMRVRTIHRTGALPNVSTGLYENVLVLREAITRALFDLLNAPLFIDNAPFSIQEQPAIFLSATLKDVTPDKILTKIPYFQLIAVEESVRPRTRPTYEEPLSAQLSVKLNDFDGECDHRLQSRIWTGKYYDLPADARENRKSEFIAILLRESGTAPQPQGRNTI